MTCPSFTSRCPGDDFIQRNGVHSRHRAPTVVAAKQEGNLP
jgi:hypothetical protein